MIRLAWWVAVDTAVGWAGVVMAVFAFASMFLLESLALASDAAEERVMRARADWRTSQERKRSFR